MMRGFKAAAEAGGSFPPTTELWVYFFLALSRLANVKWPRSRGFSGDGTYI
jgi:hypothetical protein